MASLFQRFRPGGIGRQITWLLLQYGVEAGTMTVAALLAARLFGPVAWGQLGILLAGVQLISMAGDGFFPTVIKFVSEARASGNPDAARIGWRCMWWSVLVLLAGASALGGAALAGFSGRVTVLWVGLSILLAVSRGWRASVDGIYRGLQLFRTPAIAGCITVALTAAAIIYAAAQGYRVSVYLGISAAGMIINCIWLAVLLWRKHVRRPISGVLQVEKNPVVTASEFLKYSLPLAVRGLWTFLFLKINIWMLGALATEFDAGQFRLTDQFLTIPSLMVSAVLSAIAPRIVAAHVAGPHQLELLLSRVYGLMLALTVPLALFFWFNGPVITWLFPAYGPASRMLAYFAPAMLVIGVGFAASIVPVQAGKPGLALIITVVSGICNVIAAYVGLRLGGVYGLAIGTAVVHFLTYLLGIVVTHRAFGLRFRVRFS